MNGYKILLLIMGFVFSVFIFTGVVSAASLNITEVKQAATGVKNYTETKSDIPGYVVVSNKNSSAPSFLKTITTWTLQINNGVTTPVTISSVNNPTGPSGSATGTLSKSEYLTIATNIKNYIMTNGRAPNYASSSLGNIRYESLVYAYSKILDFYKTNDRLPNSVTVVNIVGVSGGLVIPPLDYTPPTVTATPDGGTYTNIQIVTLTATDNKDPHPSIYYTTDGTSPTTSSVIYTNPLNINTNTILKFMARDASGNQAAVQTMNYIIHLVSDLTTGRNYSTIQSAIDDTTTLNGDIIQLKSATYTENIIINKSITLMAISGGSVIIQPANSSPVITIYSDGSGTTIQGLTIRGAASSHGIYIDHADNCNIIENTLTNNNNGVYATYSHDTTLTDNTATNNNIDGIYLEYSDNNTLSGNTLTFNGENGLYQYHCDHNSILDNIITNNANANIFTYFSNNNTIQNNTLTNSVTNAGLNLATSHYNTITGNNVSINGDCGISSWNSNNNIIKDNNALSNRNYGIYFYNSNNNTFESNILSNTTIYAGICLTDSSNNNTISKNTIKNNGYAGIVCYISDITTIVGNDITNNPYGININNATATIKFNRIANNTIHGLSVYNNGIVTAINNWWGTKNPIISSATGSDIYINSGTVTYNPWLTLKVTTSPTNTNGNYYVTADLTHDNNGNDTSSSGNIPDNIPINFTTTLGTIGTIAYTNKGKATSTLKCTTHGEANITVILNNQNISTRILYGVYNQNTNIIYESIQQAINASATSPGDTIIVDNRTYNENIVINKKINLIAGNGANPSVTGTITINSDGNGSLIAGLTIHGSINLNANNCTIYENTITGNGKAGITINNSINNLIKLNIIISNGYNGIQSLSSSNEIIKNNITGCNTGIYSENSNNTIKSNNIINNDNGIWTHNSTDTIQFNRITGNNYGFKNEIRTVNATNNWWGSNTPIISSNNPSDIYNVTGTVNYNPYLVLSVTVSSTNSGGNTSVKANLTHNNQGLDTSSQGFIPNGTPVNFTTNNGTIINTAFTVKGQAATFLNLNSLQPQNVTVSASTDNQSVSTTGIISTGSAVLNITSKAIDNSTGQPLNITYNIPLNNSVTWLSVVWKPTTISGVSALTEELQVIIDGNIVLYKYIYNNNVQSIDDLIFNLSYPGVAGFNITVTDPNNQITNLNFPGYVINRTSKISYTDSPYEGVHSFAIATTKVTTEIFNYWLDQSLIYLSPGGMSDAYATFMTSLMVEYAHDLIAESLSSEFNVTWSRTSPIIVSTHQDLFEVYLTLDCDHSMGMTGVGTPCDLWSFNYITSSSISPIEYTVMNGVTNSSYQSNNAYRELSSVVMDMLKYYSFNNATVESFMQNNYFIMRTINNYDYIVIDLESGIARDINTINNFCGSTATYEIIPIFGFSLTGTPHIGYPIDWFGNPWDLGTKTFYWDGSGKILLASSPYAFNPKDQISAMGEIKVKSTFGSTSFNPEKPEDTLVSGPDLEITQILMPGVENTVNVSIIASGTRHGSSALWLIQVITTPLNRPINITDITDITNDSNDDSFSHKIYELGTGITEVISGIYFYRTSNNRENTYYWQKVGNDLIDKGWDRASNALNSMWG